MNRCVWSAHVTDRGTLIVGYNLFHAYAGALDQYKEDLAIWGAPDGIWIETTKTGTYFIAAWKNTTVATVFRSFKELEAKMDAVFGPRTGVPLA